MFIKVLTKSNAHFELNIKHFSLSQYELALLKSMQNFLKMFDDVFKIIDVQKLESATSARNFIKTLENIILRLSVHVNAFI